MRILLKCPTRSRPQKFIQTLSTYMKLANNPGQIGVAVSCDEDDTSMRRNLVQEEIHNVLSKAAWKRIYFSPNKSKIQACNANMKEIEWDWQIVILVSDDMIPQLRGWDDVIRTHLLAKFPTTDGILWFNDGFQGNALNTLCVLGRAMYDSFGYIYNPEYKSLFCDTEITDLCKGALSAKCLYVSYCIIRHEHPGTGYAQNNDALYMQNQRFWNEDMYTYARRKTYAYDWSILIPTIPGREVSIHRLLESIREKVSRICPTLRIEFCIEFDNRESSVGVKRESLLRQATGKYTSFIDDDDDITDAYVEDLWACFKEGFHTMRLRGQIKEYTFTHSTSVHTTDCMVTKDDPPVFQRPPNHLNPMLAEIAKLVHFKDATRGEDLDWTLQLYRAQFLETEYRSSPDRIHYIYNLGDRIVEPSSVVYQQNVTYDQMLKTIFTPARPHAPDQQRDSVLRLGPKGFVSK
jgi:hypothetical protein